MRQSLDLAEEIAEGPGDLLAAHSRHDAERTRVVAANLDRDPGAVRQVISNRHRGREVGGVLCRRVEDLDDGGASRPRLVEELDDTADVEGPEDRVDVRRPPRELIPVLLCEAAADGDLHARMALLDALQVPEVAVKLVVGVLADAAGVENDNVCFLDVVGPLHALGSQQRCDPLGVVLVHLAAERADKVFALGSHSPRIRAPAATVTPMLFGAHVSAAGGLLPAIDRAAGMGAEVLQVHTQSPRVWKPNDYSDELLAEFARRVSEHPVVVSTVCHASYLINLGTSDPGLLEKSRACLVRNLEVATRMGAIGLVLHVGSHRGSGFEGVVSKVAAELERALDDAEHLLGGASCRLLMENTAGAGGTIGRSFAELARVLDSTSADERLGICLDTQHLFASGVAYENLDEAEAVVQLARRGDRARPARLSAPQRLEGPGRLQPGPSREPRRGSDRPPGARLAARSPGASGATGGPRGAGR